MRITPGPLALLLLVACEPEPIDTGDTDLPDTDIPEDTGETDDTGGLPPPPWYPTGQEGQVFVIERAGNASHPASLGVHAVFADQLQGYAAAPLCLSSGFCFTDLPADNDSFADISGSILDPFGSYWTWNGHSIEVADREVPFVYDPLVGHGWYSYEGDPAEDLRQFTIKFNGEWGRHQGKYSVEPMQLLEPIPGIALPARSVAAIRWVPTGGDPVFLRLKTPYVDRVWRLKDDGEFLFDPTEYGIADLDPSLYSFSIQRWTTTERNVNENSLTVQGVWEQHFDFLTCGPEDYPVGQFGQSAPPLVPVMPASGVKVGFQLVIDDSTVQDFYLDHDGDGEVSLFSAMLNFTIVDSAGNTLCTVVYDASNAVHAGAPTPISGGGTIFEAWTFDSLSNGQHDCTIIDDQIYGTKDVRQLIQSQTWGFGIGTVSATQNALKGVFNWASWEHLLGGAYIMRNDEWHEVGGVASSGLEACGTVHSGLQALPKPTQAPVPARFYTTTPVVKFNL